MPEATVHDQVGLLALPVGRYRLDPIRSRVSFTTRHVFGLGAVVGTFTLRHGQLRVADPVQTSTVSAVFAADSFTSGNSRRDLDVRSAKLLDTATYPDLMFISDKLLEAGGSWCVQGTLCAHGINQPVGLRISAAQHKGDEVVLDAVTRIDRYAFGITAARGMAGRNLDVHLAIVATAENPGGQTDDH
jgi:polyisoprenoid-binding protein YceI